MRCGPRTILQIAKRYGVSLSDEQADSICHLNGDGTSPSGMRNALTWLGFRDVEIYTDCSLMKLNTWLNAGAIVVACLLEGGTQEGHWVEIRCIDELVIVYDPDINGHKAVPSDYFQMHWIDYSLQDGAHILFNRCAVVAWPKWT